VSNSRNPDQIAPLSCYPEHAKPFEGHSVLCTAVGADRCGNDSNVLVQKESNQMVFFSHHFTGRSAAAERIAVRAPGRGCDGSPSGDFGRPQRRQIGRRSEPSVAHSQPPLVGRPTTHTSAVAGRRRTDRVSRAKEGRIPGIERWGAFASPRSVERIVGEDKSTRCARSGSAPSDLSHYGRPALTRAKTATLYSPCSMKRI